MLSHSIKSDAAPYVLAILVGADDELIENVQTKLTTPVRLAKLEVSDWNADLSPWPAPGLRVNEPFAGGAQATFKRLIERLPELRSACTPHSERMRTLLIGYSLAGLFALWAATQTSEFQGVGSVSGSLWYDGFEGFISSNPPQTDKVYLSLGSAEPRARNKRLARVGECTLAIYDKLKNGRDAAFEWNPGNHFNDAPGRLARCADWLCTRCNGGT